MSNAMCLPDPSCESREPNAPRFTKYAEETTLTREMLFELLKNLLLLLTKIKTMEGSLVPISDMEFREEFLNVI